MMKIRAPPSTDVSAARWCSGRTVAIEWLAMPSGGPSSGLTPLLHHLGNGLGRLPDGLVRVHDAWGAEYG